jgi:hypothetical protein
MPAKNKTLFHAFLLSNESPDSYRQLESRFVNSFNPRDDADRFLLEEAFAILWRCRRASAAETAAVNRQLDSTHPAGSSPEPYRVVDATHQLLLDSPLLPYLVRRETTLRRDFERMIRNIPRGE